MTITFILLTLLFVIVSVAMILIILVQRPQGGGLAGAFGGAGGGSTESVFGGRVGDALTWATVVAFVVYLGVAISLNLMDGRPVALAEPTPIEAGASPRPEPARRVEGTAGEPVRIERTVTPQTDAPGGQREPIAIIPPTGTDDADEAPAEDDASPEAAQEDDAER